MNKIKQNHSSLKKINSEAKIIYRFLMDDIGLSNYSISGISCEMMPCNDIKEIFDLKTRFSFVFNFAWSQKTIDEINSGMSGLILDEMNNENVFSQDVFKKFFIYLNSLLTRNNMLKAVMSNLAIKELNRKYKNNYKLIEVKDIFLNFSKNKKDHMSPDIYIEIQVERNQHVSELV